MKTDIITIAFIVLTVGVLISSIGFDEAFASDEALPPSALHQGVILR